LIEIIEKLAKKETLPPKNRDHNLSGNYANFRECHIQPDWLLIYKYDQETLYLTRTGGHSDLF
jgi:mRNA interferase YafQ